MVSGREQKRANLPVAFQMCDEMLERRVVGPYPTLAREVPRATVSLSFSTHHPFSDSRP